MVYIMVYTIMMWYIPCNIYHGSYGPGYILSKSGIYHGATLQRAGLRTMPLWHHHGPDDPAMMTVLGPGTLRHSEAQ
jgi:hypothetical protein